LTFNKIVCPTSLICRAIGSDGPVAKSTDGGREWSDPALRVNIVDTLDISCPSASVCVVPVDAGVLGRSQQPPRFLVTHNGGATWTLIAPPKGVAGLGAISCADTQHCLAIGTAEDNSGEVLSSPDGGLDWQVASRFSTPGFPALYCKSETFCIRASGGYSESGPKPELTSISSDEGKTFTSGARLTGAEQISAITCASAHDCVAVGSTFTQGEPGPGEAAAYASTNGGRSWKRVALAKSLATVSSVACATESRCVAAATGFSSPAPSSSFGVLLSSTDAGLHWRITTQGKNVPAATVASSGIRRFVAGASMLVATA
jgi:photosystem II stability/assembly factor-like uncharacterized protein